MASMEVASYWCYKCSRTVTPNPGAQGACPVCGDGFLEEIEAPTVTENGVPPFGDEAPSSQMIYFTGDSDAMAHRSGQEADANGPRSQPWIDTFAGFGTNPRNLPEGNPGILQFLEEMSSFFQQVQPQAPSRGTDAAADDEEGTNTGLFNPTIVMQGTLENFLGGGGSVEISFDNGTGVGPRLLPGNMGDYFFGSGLQQLIQQLAENDPNRYGTPPASKAAIQSLPTITISEEHVGTDYAVCAVCRDEFVLGAEVRKMPCKHMYHADCILPWLSQHNSCPVCRFELPTDDLEYNDMHITQPSPPPSSSPPPVPQPNGGGEADREHGNEGLLTWGTGLTIGRTQEAEAVIEQMTEASDTRSSLTDVPSQDDGIDVGGRRISFQLPWPFHFNNATFQFDNVAVSSPEVSISDANNLGENQASDQSAGISSLAQGSVGDDDPNGSAADHPTEG